MISKPIVPPWNDSGKNLVKDLVSHGRRFRYRVFTRDGFTLPQPQVESEPLYRDGGRYTPSLVANARVFARLCRADQAALRHYFFAPNPVTSGAARVVGVVRRVPTVQTVSSSPASYRGLRRLLFGDRIIVLSEYNRRRIVAAGVDPSRVVRIPPCVEVPASLDDDAGERARRRYRLDGEVIVYPGDYQFSTAARTMVRAMPWLLERRPGAMLVLACRIKQEASRAEEELLRREAGRLGIVPRVRFLNEVDDIHDLLSAADVVALPAGSTYAKMDLPLVLLEAMARAVPVVVADAGPLPELAEGGAAEVVRPEDERALAELLAALLADPGRRRAMGEAGRAAALDRFTPQDVARRHEAVYDDLLDRATRRE